MIYIFDKYLPLRYRKIRRVTIERTFFKEFLSYRETLGYPVTEISEGIFQTDGYIYSERKVTMKKYLRNNKIKFKNR